MTIPAKKSRLTIVAYGELPPGTSYPCDARSSTHQRRGADRSRFGLRSAISYSGTCPAKAVARVLLSDGSVTNRCFRHRHAAS